MRKQCRLMRCHSVAGLAHSSVHRMQQHATSQLGATKARTESFFTAVSALRSSGRRPRRGSQMKSQCDTREHGQTAAELHSAKATATTMHVADMWHATCEGILPNPDDLSVAQTA
eukprot:6456250-Amphidinium_carterae.2